MSEGDGCPNVAETDDGPALKSWAEVRPEDRFSSEQEIIDFWERHHTHSESWVEGRTKDGRLAWYAPLPIKDDDLRGYGLCWLAVYNLGGDGKPDDWCMETGDPDGTDTADPYEALHEVIIPVARQQWEIDERTGRYG